MNSPMLFINTVSGNTALILAAAAVAAAIVLVVAVKKYKPPNLINPRKIWGKNLSPSSQIWLYTFMKSST
jgi:hypothetical protein